MLRSWGCIAGLALLMLIVGLVDSARVHTVYESADDFQIDAMSTGNKKCKSLQKTYKNMRNKLEKSVRKGKDLTNAKNIVRLLRASRNLKSAIRKDCNWVKTENGTAAPSLGELVQTKLAEMPCAKTAKALMDQGNYLQAVDVYVSDEDECTPHKREFKPNVTEVVVEEKALEAKLAAASTDGKISLLEQYAVSGEWKPWVVVLVVVLTIFFFPVVVTIALWALLITALICAFSKQSFGNCMQGYWDNWGY